MRNTIDRWWFNNYKENPYVNIQVNQVETCKEMIINKLGYAILANLVVHPYPELTVKTLHSPSGEPITRKTWMYYHAESLQLNIVQAFVSFIRTLRSEERRVGKECNTRCVVK